jgi:hypothetical protein
MQRAVESTSRPGSRVGSPPRRARGRRPRRRPPGDRLSRAWASSLDKHRPAGARTVNATSGRLGGTPALMRDRRFTRSYSAKEMGGRTPATRLGQEGHRTAYEHSPREQGNRQDVRGNSLSPSPGSLFASTFPCSLCSLVSRVVVAHREDCYATIVDRFVTGRPSFLREQREQGNGPVITRAWPFPGVPSFHQSSRPGDTCDQPLSRRPLHLPVGWLTFAGKEGFGTRVPGQRRDRGLDSRPRHDGGQYRRAAVSGPWPHALLGDRAPAPEVFMPALATGMAAPRRPASPAIPAVVARPLMH